MCVLIWFLQGFLRVRTLMRPSASMICSSNFLLDFHRFLVPFFIQNPWKMGSRTPSRRKSTLGTNFTDFCRFLYHFGYQKCSEIMKKVVSKTRRKKAEKCKKKEVLLGGFEPVRIKLSCSWFSLVQARVLTFIFFSLFFPFFLIYVTNKGNRHEN